MIRVEQPGIALKVQRPSLIAVHRLADTLPALAVTVQVAVLQLDPGRPGTSATNLTSTSLVLSRSPSICQEGPMSQLNTSRWGGS
jgi:hypothetical protein